MIDFNTAGKQKSESYWSAPPTNTDPSATFLSQAAELGCEIGVLITDGTLQRFDIGKKGNKAGWYIFHLHNDFASGVIGNWKTGLKQNWCSKSDHELSAGEKEKLQVQRKIDREKRQALQEKIQGEAKSKANFIWNNAKPADQGHLYLKTKNVAPHDTRQSRGSLVIPVSDKDGVIHTLQFITPGNEKRFLFGGKKKGCSFTIQGDSNLIICEGFSTGASIHQATGSTVIVAFDCGNLESVARVVRRQCPDSNITIAADNDRFTTDNPGIKDAQKAGRAINANVTWPDFSNISGGDDPDNKLTDFNDLATVAGSDIVSEQLENPLTKKKTILPPQGPEDTNFKLKIHSRPTALEYILSIGDQGLIAKGIVGVLSATGGTGKSFFLLSLAMVAASGKNFGPIHAPKPLNTLVVCAEDSQDELVRRTWDICGGVFPEKFHALSIYGEMGPLLKLEGGAPVLGEAYHWLDATIAKHHGLELLVLDPMSRLFGLDENNNAHATAFIQALESLVKKHGDMTIIFSNHTSKDRSGQISQNMSRGASALVDGCRWQAGLVRMDKKTADYYEIDKPRQYVIFDTPKNNYAAEMPSQLFFRRTDTGVLVFCNLKEDSDKAKDDCVCEMIKADSIQHTRRELCRDKYFIADIKDKFKQFKRDDLSLILDRLIEQKKVKEVAEGEGREQRILLLGV